MTKGKRRFGRNKPNGCECDYRFTCRVCCDAAVARNRVEREAQPAGTDYADHCRPVSPLPE